MQEDAISKVKTYIESDDDDRSWKYLKVEFEGFCGVESCKTWEKWDQKDSFSL